MGTEVANMDAFKNAKVAAAFAGLDPHEESLSDGIGSSYAVIGYKGKTWSIRHRGDKFVFKRADDGTPVGYLDVIILRQARVKSKSYYAEYVEGADGTRPICASLDGVTPDSDVQQKQADACSLCPRNVWRTAPNGRKERDCSDYKRLAVLPLPSQTQVAMGQPLMEPAFLRVPPSSLDSLSVMGDTMSQQGYHFRTYITRITFDPAAAHPKFMFRALQPLTDAEGAAVAPLIDDPVALRITGEDEIARRQNQPRLAAPALMTNGNPVAAIPPATAAVTPQVTNITAAPAAIITAVPDKVDTGFAQALPNPTVGGGALKGAFSVPAGETTAGANTATATVQTTEDIGGAAEESDENLDAEIANLLSTGDAK